MTATIPAARHRRADAHGDIASGGPLGGQGVCDAHGRVAVEGPNIDSGQSLSARQDRPAAVEQYIRNDQATRGSQDALVVAEQFPSAPAIEVASPSVEPPGLADPLLALAADVLDDLERVRVANENRLRQLTRDETDADGGERGFGLDQSHPDVARLATLVEALARAEHDATLQLQRQLRRHPLGPWVKRTVGVGEKQAARLLAAIGDPSWNDLHGRPRTVSELWAYCGYHVVSIDHGAHDAQGVNVGGAGSDPGQVQVASRTGDAGVAATPRRGQRANWAATAKMRAFLIAESCIKQALSPYRPVYDAGREKYADAVHASPCKRCGPAGHPAAVGTPISAGHQHARALRLVSKALLRDLWREARAIHEGAAA